ncbi:hypothetical protein FVE85_8664 [Porphyridium purpureum]|uniref:CCHC-type domain-containing protein n=1 Tax=Porphyridium purpureum TaxID=35688 RepID=A0A5J4YP57_PORPP|nr:hypothetical protein FVE85_8664 [Porphyridium purpureum]|eukprot:POR8104..scf296_7
MDGEQSRLREAQPRTLAPELAQFRQQLEVQFQQQLESLQAQFVSQLEEQRAAMQHAQSETQALRHQLELARQQTDAVNRAEGPAPNPVASVHRVKSLQPAPMTYYSGERSRLAVTDWCTAAQDRVFDPAKKEWALMGCQWTSDQELEVVSTLTTYLTGDAKGWYQSLSASEKPSSVQAFLKVVNERFLPFEKEEQTTIKKDVAKMEPKTYQKMVRWAIKMDEIENDRSSEEQVNIQTWTTAAQQGPLQALGLPARTDYALMELGNAAAKHHGKTKEGSGGKRRPKRNDTCNHCGQKGHWARDCKASPPGTSHAKERQVHSLELCAARKEPEMCPSELIEIEALVDEKPAAAIVDTGATHTFLSSRWCQLAGMPVNKARGKPVGVRLADGSLKNTLGTARVLINVPGTEASEQDVVVYDGRRDLILGMDWLRRNKTALQVGGRVLMNVELDHNVLHCPARHDCDICKFAKIRKKRAPRRAKQGDEDEDDMPPPFNNIVSVNLLDPGQPGGDGTRFLLTHLDHSTKWFQLASMADKSADEAL